MKKIFIAVVLLLVLGAGCFAQERASRIDSLMRTLAERGQFNGSVLVAEQGTVAFEGGFGKADKEHNIEFTASTPCYLASLTKQFTAMAVMMLMERHKLSYDDPLSKYFSAFPPYARSVTIRHLLNHVSGVPEYVSLGLEHPGLTNAEVLRALVKQDSLGFPPGSKFEYSNSNYVLLALIIEQVSGESYRDFIENNIFRPLGMDHSFVADGSPRTQPLRARGYTRFGDLDDYNLATVGEGGIYSTVQDMFTWDQALYTEKLVHTSTLGEAFTRPKLADGSKSGYGFGWGLADVDGETVTSHAGRYGGFNTYIKRFPRERNSVIFLTNHGFKSMGAIGNALISILNDKPFVLPKRSIAELLYKIYSSDGMAPALQRYRSLKTGNDTTYDFKESELNELGYEFLGLKQTSEAIEVLKLNAEEYPASSNVYDGLGEAYMDHGDNELAIRNYKRSLELDPGNTNAAAMLKKLHAQ